jgi:hypothetical protein
MLSSQQTTKLHLCIAMSVCCVLSLAPIASAQQLIKPEDHETSIPGTIRLIHGYGPPGYGEDPKHDVHISYWALETQVPINTQCTPEKAEFAKYDCAPAKQMKLFFAGLELTKLANLPAAKWKDRRVIVHGKLHRADTAGEMTPIYIDVTTISAAPNQKAQNR